MQRLRAANSSPPGLAGASQFARSQIFNLSRFAGLLRAWEKGFNSRKLGPDVAVFVCVRALDELPNIIAKQLNIRRFRFSQRGRKRFRMLIWRDGGESRVRIRENSG